MAPPPIPVTTVLMLPDSPFPVRSWWCHQHHDDGGEQGAVRRYAFGRLERGGPATPLVVVSGMANGQEQETPASRVLRIQKAPWGGLLGDDRPLSIDKVNGQIGRWLLAAVAKPRRLEPLLDALALNPQKLVPDRERPRAPQPKSTLSHAYK